MSGSPASSSSCASDDASTARSGRHGNAHSNGYEERDTTTHSLEALGFIQPAPRHHSTSKHHHGKAGDLFGSELAWQSATTAGLTRRRSSHTWQQEDQDHATTNPHLPPLQPDAPLAAAAASLPRPRSVLAPFWSRFSISGASSDYNHRDSKLKLSPIPDSPLDSPFGSPNPAAFSTSADPLLALGAADLRRTSFATTSAATNGGVSPAASRLARAVGPPPPSATSALTPRRVRLILIRAILVTSVLAVGYQLWPLVADSVLSAGESHPPTPVHRAVKDDFRYPDAFTSLVKDGAPDTTLIPLATPVPPRSTAHAVTFEHVHFFGNRNKHEDEGLTQALAVSSSASALRRWRETHLYGPPSDKVETDVQDHREDVEHEATVIFMHGLDQHFWDDPLVPHLRDKMPAVRWVRPKAPERHISVAKRVTTGWFDMHAWPYNNAHDESPTELFASVRLLNAIVTSERDKLIRQLRKRGGLQPPDALGAPDEVRGELGTKRERAWASSRILLAGFSQGSVISLLTALTARDELAGVAVLSGFMPLRKQLAAMTRDLKRSEFPVFWGHGVKDPYLLHSDAITSITLLTSQHPTRAGLGGVGLSDVEWHSYPEIDHTFWAPELDDLASWMEGVLPKEAFEGGADAVVEPEAKKDEKEPVAVVDKVVEPQPKMKRVKK